jgi:hypothetical protein
LLQVPSSGPELGLCNLAYVGWSWSVKRLTKMRVLLNRKANQIHMYILSSHCFNTFYTFFYTAAWRSDIKSARRKEDRRFESHQSAILSEWLDMHCMCYRKKTMAKNTLKNIHFLKQTGRLIHFKIRWHNYVWKWMLKLWKL